MAYGRWLVDKGYDQTAREVVWPIVRNDLNYVAQYWHESSIDFWSSPRGTYLVDAFFIRAVQHRALVAGAAFARAVGEQCAVCEGQGPQVLCSMQGFRRVGEEMGIVVADMVNGTVADRSGYDASTVFASIFNFDPEAGCEERTFQPCSEGMLRNQKEVVDQFRVWVINAGIEAGRPVAIGRFPGDMDDNDHGMDIYIPFMGYKWYLADRYRKPLVCLYPRRRRTTLRFSLGVRKIRLHHHRQHLSSLLASHLPGR